MSRRDSFREERKARLARRVEVLDALEPRNLITDPLSLTALAAGLPIVMGGVGSVFAWGDEVDSGRDASPPDLAPATPFAARTPPGSYSPLQLSPPIMASASTGAAGAGWLAGGPMRPAVAQAGPTSGNWRLWDVSPTLVRADSPPAPLMAKAISAGLGTAAGGSQASSAGGGPSTIDATVAGRTLGQTTPSAPAGDAAPSFPWGAVGMPTRPVGAGDSPLQPVPAGPPARLIGRWKVYRSLNYLHGNVLFPGAIQMANMGGTADFRAQATRYASLTEPPMYSNLSFSWDTSSLTTSPSVVVAGSIAGANGPNLTFTWAANNATASIRSLVLTITPPTGTPAVLTYLVYVPAASGAVGVTAPAWQDVLSPDLLIPGGQRIGAHNVSIATQTGALETSIDLPAYSPNVPPLSLEYNSLSADPRPIFVVRHAINSSPNPPTQVTGQITVGSVAGPTTTYTGTEDLMSGAIMQMGLQDDLNSLASGRYSYTATIADTYATVATTIYNGSTTVINEASNPFGAGWTLDGWNRAISTASGVALLTGDNESLWFTLSGGAYISPAGDFSTLVKNGDNSFTRTLPDGVRQNFRATDGYQTSVVDRNGLRTTYGYDASTAGKLTTVTDPYNKVTTFGYDGSSKLQTVIDPAGRIATFTHSGAALTSAKLPDNALYTYAYDSANRLTTLTDPRSNVEKIAYDSAGRVGTITRPDNTTQKYSAYQEQGWSGTGSTAAVVFSDAASTYTDPLGRVYTLRPDWYGQGKVNQPNYPDGSVATTNRDVNGLILTDIDPLGRVATNAYDSMGNLAGRTNPDGGRSTYTYNGFSEVLTATDPRGKTTSFTYDVEGNLTGVKDPLNNATTLTYTANGRVETYKDARNNVVSYAYDSQDRPTTVTYPGGATRRLSYDSRGNVATVVNELSKATTYAYDAMNRVVGTTDALANRTTLTYDGAGNLTATQSPTPALALPRTTTYAYDAMDRLTTVTAPLGRVTKYAYDNAGRLTSTADPLNRGTQYAYDNRDRVTTITDALGHAATLAYDAVGNMVGETDVNGRATSYAYDAMDRLAGVTAPLGRISTYTYDLSGNRTTATDPSGRTTTMAYDALNRLSTVTDARGGVASVAYDAVGNVSGTTDARSNRTTFAYDARNRLTTITAPSNRITTMGYDAAGNLTRTTDALGRATTMAYDALNRVTTVTDPLNHVATVAYDVAGRLAGSTNANGERTAYAYDSADRLTTLTDANNLTTTYGYDLADNLTRVTDPAAHATVLGYDNLDRLTSVTDPLGHAVTYGYDYLGNLTGVKDANDNRTTYAYDAADRLTTITGALNRVTTYSYDLADNQTGQTDPNGYRTTYAYDRLDRLTTITDPRGATTSMAYDAVGNLTGMTDPNGNRTTWAYDSADRLTTLTDPFGRSNTYQYDNGDQLVGTTDRNGRRTTYAYDAGGRQTGETWVGAPSTQVATYTYDDVGRLTGARDSFAALTFAYDNGGRMTTAVTKGAAGQPLVTMTYGYDAAGNRSSLVDSLSSVGRTTYQYDAADRLTTIATSQGGAGGPRIVFGYDVGDRLTSISRTVNGAGTAVNTALSYDAADRLTTMIHQVGGGAVLATYLYSYDPGDRVTRETNAEGAVTYLYDAADQLTGTTGSRAETYTYDGAGNRTMAGYATGTANQVTSGAGSTYTYDNEGNLSSERNTTTGVVTAYTYDYRNRLTGVSVGGVATATYTYDPLDRRIGANLGGVQTWTAYDGGSAFADPYADFNASGTLTNRYTSGPAVDQLLARTTGAITSWYLPDRLGTIRDVANASGGVIDHVIYDSFGKVASETNAANGDRFKYAGMEYDAAIALYYAHARYYDPAVGKFIQQDPIGLAAGDSNFYRYVGNQAPNAVDPLGLKMMALQDDRLTDGDGNAVNPVAGESSDKGYLRRSAEQLILGDYSKEDPTLLGTAAQIGTGLIGVDLPADIRDLSEKFVHWEWSWSHGGKTLLNVAAMLPVVGALKYADEAVYVMKGADDVADAAVDIAKPVFNKIDDAKKLADKSDINPSDLITKNSDAINLPKKPDTITPSNVARPADSPNYSVGYEARLRKDVDYPGVKDTKHFQEANRQLHEDFQADPKFAEAMEEIFPGIVEGVKPGKRGAFPSGPPTKDVTWHHHPTREGSLELVPRPQHRAPGPIQDSLHPNQQGGMEIWGGGRK